MLACRRRDDLSSPSQGRSGIRNKSPSPAVSFSLGPAVYTMAEQNKTVQSPGSDHSQGQPMYTLQQPGIAPYAPYGPYYPYPVPPPDANGQQPDPNAPNSSPAYMMAFPTPPAGMIYAYPSPQGMLYLNCLPDTCSVFQVIRAFLSLLGCLCHQHCVRNANKLRWR